MRFDAAYLDQISEKLYAAILADTMDGLGYPNQIMGQEIRPVSSQARVVGRAATLLATDVYSTPEKPLELQIALIDSLVPGEVVVIGSSSCRAAMWGELMSTGARVRGARGAVIDGASRDSWATNAMEFPIFARGLMAASSVGRMDGVALRVPVEVGGVLVNNGDLVFGDQDGCVVVPQAIEDEVIKLALEKVSSENKVRDEVMRGSSLREAYEKFGAL